MSIAMQQVRATAVAFDELTERIDINFLKEGDPLKAVRTVAGEEEVIYALADMDGHAVSPNYGWSQGLHIYDEGLGKAYINVKRLDRALDYYTWEAARARNKTGVPTHTGNESLMERDGWQVFSLPAVAARQTQSLLEQEVMHLEVQATLTLEAAGVAAQVARDAGVALTEARRKLAAVSK